MVAFQPSPSPGFTVQDRLLFVIGSPRSGSTMLARMLGAHSAIFSRPEPHLLTPLAHLGYYDNVERAPYDHLQAQMSVREFVNELPGGEQDYLKACRAYTDYLYAQILEPRGKRFFLDKTPAYALVLPFIARLYPKAKFVVLTRHPLAVFSSFANSFFDGDYQVAQAHNPLLNRYVPAIARFIRGKPAPLIHVRYENIVKQPEQELPRICEFLGIPFEPGMIEYGKHEQQGKGLGDPIGVNKHDRPVTKSVSKWALELSSDPAKLRMMQEIIDSLEEKDLETWGFPKKDLWKALDKVEGGARPAKEKLDRYRLERKVLVALRRNIHQNALGTVVRRVKFYCDVLLRE